MKDVEINSWIMLALNAQVKPEIAAYYNQLLVPAVCSDQYLATQKGFSFQKVPAMNQEEMNEFIKKQKVLYQSLLKNK